MSADLLREAAEHLGDSNDALEQSIALLLVNEANAMESHYVPYNRARQDLLVSIAEAVLPVTA